MEAYRYTCSQHRQGQLGNVPFWASDLRRPSTEMLSGERGERQEVVCRGSSVKSLLSEADVVSSEGCKDEGGFGRSAFICE